MTRKRRNGIRLYYFAGCGGRTVGAGFGARGGGYCLHGDSTPVIASNAATTTIGAAWCGGWFRGARIGIRVI